jgi:hypothetical protein
MRSNDLKNIGGTAKEIITDSRIFIESMTSGFLRQAMQEIECLKKTFACAPNCLPTCTKRVFAEFKNGHIKIAYEHIFGMELTWAKKGYLEDFSGFHHDLIYAMEKSNAIQLTNKVVKDNGCYIADLIIDGLRIPDKTFFPANWSREQVVSKIYEAYENFVKSGVTPELNRQGKYIINGYTSEGIKIQMIITRKGHMKTAYPYFK